MRVLEVRALLSYYLYYGDKFKIECPTGSGNLMNLPSRWPWERSLTV